MSPSARPTPPVLCLGEALVDLIGEEPAESLAQVGRFIPHFGGTVATVAVAAAKAGASVALAGGAGEDEWGRWLRDRLVAEGVDVSRFALRPGVNTRLAFAAVDRAGEPSYELYGEPLQSVVPALDDGLHEAVGAAAGLLISSDTLVDSPEREVTMRARAAALELGRPVVFDVGLRLDRWASRADAAPSANACVPGACLVRAGRAEAELMTGERDPERAAMAIRKAGAEMVALTLGAEGAILRGSRRAEVGAVAADVVSTIGAGDAFTGTLLARLALSDFYPSAVAAGLGDAARAAAQACERWGSLD